MKTFSQRLIAAMDTPPKVTQVALAKACGVAQPTVNDWRSAKSQSMGMEYLFTAARKLGVNPEWLATGKGEMRVQHADVLSQSQPLGLDPVILSEALKWLSIFEDQRGAIPYPARGQRLIQIYDRLVADGGQAGPATFAEFMSHATEGHPPKESEANGRRGARTAGKGGKRTS